MKLIRPVTVEGAVFVSSSVAEDPVAAWSGETTYATDGKASRATTHRVYQSLVDGNVNKVPEDNPAQWQDIGPTNRWAMFDRAVGTKTEGVGTIEVVVSPGAVDSVALVDVSAEGAEVVMTHGDVEVYRRPQSFNAGGSAITDWALYFFEPIGVRQVLTFLDLPNYGDGQITVTLTGADPDGPVTCGTMIVGRQLDCGDTGADIQPGIADFSEKSTDNFGAIDVVERDWSKRMQLVTRLPSSSVDAVYREVAAIRAKPVLWLADESFDCLTVYGFFQDFQPVINTRRGQTLINWTIEGLI